MQVLLQTEQIYIQMHIRMHTHRYISYYTVGIRCTQPPDIFPLTPVVNKSCNNECCVNKMLRNIQNMMVSQGFELEQSMFRRTTIVGQHPLV